MEEVWKDVQGYEHLFQVSNLGNVFSKRSNRLLKQHTRSDGRKSLVTRVNRDGLLIVKTYNTLLTQD